MLRPGERGEVTIYGRTTTLGNEDFQLFVAEYPAVPIDWSLLEASIRPDGLTDNEWATLFTQLQTDIGSTWDGYHQTISDAATLLGPSSGPQLRTLGELLSVALDHAKAESGNSVTGRLFLGDQTRPLADTSIQLFDPTTGVRAITQSYADGTFVFPNLAAGTYDVTVDGFTVTSDNTLVVDPGGEIDVNIVADTGRILGGVILAAGGIPQAGVQVTATAADGRSYSTETSADGTYAITTLPEGTYDVAALHNSLTRLTKQVVVTQGQDLRNVVFALNQVAVISGTVTASGAAIEGALVSAISASGFIIIAESDQDGNYSIVSLPGDTFSVRASAEGFARPRRPASPWQPAVKLMDKISSSKSRVRSPEPSSKETTHRQQRSCFP